MKRTDGATPFADSVYRNGNIYTMEESAFHAAALAVRDGRLAYVGGERGAEAFIGPTTRVTDLKGRTVLPGLIESHLHFTAMGKTLLTLDAMGMSKEAVLTAVAAEAAKRQPGEWIRGRGWNQERWRDNRFPTKEELDEAAPEHPVVLTRACGHAAWVNSAALRLAGVTRDTPDPDGGEILHGPDGEPLGILTDTAMDAVYCRLPEEGDGRAREAMRLAQGQLFAFGVTGAVDAGVDAHTIALFHELYAAGELKLRLYACVFDEGDSVKPFFEQGPKAGLYGGRFSVRAVKFMGDGSLGARSAWMLSEYADRPGHRGNGRYTDGDLAERFEACGRAGFQILIHAIGDAANSQVLDAWSLARGRLPQGDFRPRIEHFQIVAPGDFRRIADLGMVASMQFVHAASDIAMAQERLGPERVAGAYAWRKTLAAGSIIAAGSDAPVESANPFHGLYAAVVRAGVAAGLPRGGWYPGETLTRFEALRAFTLHGAYAQFAEGDVGSLEPGKRADFVVIDRDYMACAPEEIKAIRVLRTVLEGETVYEAGV